VFPGVDGRTIQARRFQQLLGGLSAEFENISEPDKSLIRNAAFLVLKCEDLQAQHLRGEPVANDEIIRLSALLNRSMLAALRGACPHHAEYREPLGRQSRRTRRGK
jgi:hypothetical protein